MPATCRAVVGLLVWAATMWWFYHQIDPSNPKYKPAMLPAGICTVIILLVCLPRILGVFSHKRSSQQGNDGE